MGMPRYVKDGFDAWIKELNGNPAICMAWGFQAGLNSDKCRDAMPVPTTDSEETDRFFHKACLDRLKRYFKYVMDHKHHEFSDPKSVLDDLEKVPSAKYVGLQDFGSQLVEDRIPVLVSRFFVPKLEELNRDRRESDLEELALKAKIAETRDKVYASRSFPVSLRAIIFERDGYCCQVCGKHKAELIKNGSHLEVDHIVPWVDGGLTTYDNGQTICSPCNKGKHHAAQYIAASRRLRVAPE